MTHRFAAVLGSIAHGIRSFAASILSLVGLQGLARFVVPALVALLAVSAVQSAMTTAAILDDRPQVTEATLAEVAAFDGGRGESIWFQFDALADATSHASSADTGTFFFLARDPEDPSRGILARTSRGDAFFRQRTVGAALVDDPEAVADALGAVGGVGGLTVDGTRYLDETESTGDPDEAFLPSQLSDEAAGSSVLVTGRVVSPGQFAACALPQGCEGEDARWWYVLADPEGPASILLRSPHPPTDIPVQLQGLFLRDTFDLAPVLESEWFASIEADVPTNRALNAGTAPPVTVETSWLPAILAAVFAAILLVSFLAGYPVFGPEPNPPATRALGPGERVDVTITGRIGRDRGSVALASSPGAVERLGVGDLALLLWRYGLLPRDQTRREAEERYVAAAVGQRDRLLIHERDQSALVVVDRGSDASQVSVGRLHRLGGSVPAVRFRQATSDAFLETRSVNERDRIAGELLGESTPDGSAAAG